MSLMPVASKPRAANKCRAASSIRRLVDRLAEPSGGWLASAARSSGCRLGTTLRSGSRRPGLTAVRCVLDCIAHRAEPERDPARAGSPPKPAYRSIGNPSLLSRTAPRSPQRCHARPRPVAARSAHRRGFGELDSIIGVDDVVYLRAIYPDHENTGCPSDSGWDWWGGGAERSSGTAKRAGTGPGAQERRDQRGSAREARPALGRKRAE